MSYPLIGGHYFLILFFLVLLSFLYLFDLCGKGMKKSNCDEVISILLCSLYRDVMQECFILAMFLNNSVLFVYSRPCTRPQSSLSPYIFDRSFRIACKSYRISLVQELLFVIMLSLSLCFQIITTNHGRIHSSKSMRENGYGVMEKISLKNHRVGLLKQFHQTASRPSKNKDS